MIVDLPSTTTAAVSKKLVQLRQDVGAMALGRVLTLVIVVDEQDFEGAIEAANDASRQHPCRIIVVVIGNRRGSSRLDAQIRVGGDAGASEVVVLRLYGALTEHGRSVVTPLLLPDSPVVAWWPKDAPANVSQDPIGSMAQRRITDAAEARQPHAELKNRAKTYADGDTDLAWTRITLWRGLLAAALDQPPYEPVLAATVTGASDSPSTDLLAAWLAQTLRCPVTRTRTRAGVGMISVRLERKSGVIDLVRPDGHTATLTQPGQPVRRISLARRGLAECLADELRRLDPDDIYEATIRRGLARVGKGKTSSEAVSEGEAPSVDEARRAARRAARHGKATSSTAIVETSPPPKPTDSSTVKKAAARRLASTKAGSQAASAAEVRPTASSKVGVREAGSTVGTQTAGTKTGATAGRKTGAKSGTRARKRPAGTRSATRGTPSMADQSPDSAGQAAAAMDAAAARRAGS